MFDKISRFMISRNFERALEIVREDGFPTLLKKIPPFIYEQIWPYLPKRDPVSLNNVPIHANKRVLDSYLPPYLLKYVPHDDETYEAEYVGLIKDHIDKGESVVLVGGGEGVSTVVAARQVNSSGTVITYEGSAQEVNKSRRTIQVNGLDERASVKHAIVSEDVQLRSDPGGADVISSNNLPDCTTLAIDADGAEFSILESLEIRPPKIIVEHHPIRVDDEVVIEYEPDHLIKLLESMGYEIVDECIGHSEQLDMTGLHVVAEYDAA